MATSSQRFPLSVLPRVPGLCLAQAAIDAETITFTLMSTQTPVPCPLCDAPTARRHSQYERTLADLPWGRHAVRLRLRVRRFRCPVPTCQRRVFTERLPTLVAPYGRRTLRLRAVLGVVALALGGEAGARLLERLSMPASPATLLRLIRQMAPPTPPVVQAIGIDDFALRRGRRYGTVIVDQERRRPLDLLPDRSAETLAAWLRRHETLTTITRDRSTEYARGIAAGAPQAVQILDRWHLHKNLREAVERVLNGQRQALPSIALPERQAQGPAPAALDDLAPPARARAERVQSHATRERRRQYEQVRTLYAQGVSLNDIKRRLGCSRGLVRRYAHADAFPERRPHPRQPSMLDPFEPYLHERWAQGARTALHLWREVRERGYPGSPKRVIQWVQQRREEPAPTTPGRHRRGVLQRIAAGPRRRRASIGQLTWLLLRDPDDLEAAEHTALAQLRAASPLLERTYALSQEFQRILRRRAPDALEAWFTQAAASDIPDLQTFAEGLAQERDALRQALVQPYSNGISEGFVNKIKVLKRQMYGRANVDLLRLRLLLA